MSAACSTGTADKGEPAFLAIEEGATKQDGVARADVVAAARKIVPKATEKG